MACIAKGLQENKWLKQLNLYGNYIEKKAIEVLAPVLAENHILEIFSLGSCRLCAASYELLCEF